jgi:acylphosphatase
MTDMHVRVTGVVQGVGFRWFVRERARRLGLAGWVRNLPDGSVEVAAKGEDQQMALFRADLRRGPRGAAVEDVEDLGASLPQPLTDPFGIIH